MLLWQVLFSLVFCKFCFSVVVTEHISLNKVTEGFIWSARWWKGNGLLYLKDIRLRNYFRRARYQTEKKWNQEWASFIRRIGCCSICCCVGRNALRDNWGAPRLPSSVFIFFRVWNSVDHLKLPFQNNFGNLILKAGGGRVNFFYFHSFNPSRVSGFITLLLNRWSVTC